MLGDVTIDIGIDLGTTNSAIAVFDAGMSKIIKSQATAWQADVTPSVVSIAGTREWVGAAAKERLVDHPQATFYEFKRTIGTTTTYPLLEGGRITPEDLSARILRSLRQDAFEETGVDITAAVITVPAAFDTAQIAATRNAGHSAGFQHVETLQEPIAAALAYGFDRTSDGMFLIFDLGGGTFDAALLRCVGGVFSVVNHRGDNDLGGGKWDAAIIDMVVLPNLDSMGYTLASARDRHSSTFRRLKPKAEKARIELSRKETTSFEFPVSMADDNGRPFPDDLQLSLAEFEPLIDQNLSDCVTACQELLQEGGVRASDVSKIVLVGGPTRTPALRRAIEGLGIELATMVDPMTVVARGAAVYAASRTRPVVAASGIKESALFQLVYDAMVERDKDEALIGVKLERSPTTIEVAGIRIVAVDGSWDSGSVRLDNGNAIVSAKLIAPGIATFRLTASAADGTSIPATPDKFSVTRAVAAAPAPINHSIGLAVDHVEGSATFEKIVNRNTTMPVFERRTFRSTRLVSPREPEADPIRLLFLEGESNVPERNLKVGEIVITFDVITRPLPADSEIEIVLRWEQGQDPKVSAYIPYLDQQFSSVLTMQNKQLPDIDLLEDQVAQIRATLGQEVSSSDARGKRLHELEVRLADARHGDAAAAHSAAAQIGPLLDAIEADSSSELRDAAVAQLEQAEEWARAITAKFGTPEDQGNLETLINEARGSVAGGSHRDVDYRRDRIIVHTWRVIFRQPGFWVEELAELATKAASSTDPVRAGALIQQGQAALEQQKLDELQAAVRALWQLFPTSSNAIQSYGIRPTNT